MGMGTLICGLNGSGKNTLGKALAELILPCAPVKKLQGSFFNEFKAHENFVYASVKGNYGKQIYPFFWYAVLIAVAACKFH